MALLWPRRAALAGPLLAPLLLAGCGEKVSAKEASPAAPARPAAAGISARGRLQPKDGVLKVNGPSDIVAVVARLDVDQGDRVAAGDRLAVMDTFAPRQARAAQLRARIEADAASADALAAELGRAEAEDRRSRDLSRKGVLSPSDKELAETRMEVARARLRQAREELAASRAALATAEVERDLAVVRAPVAAQVLKVHARAGEKVGPDGILTLGRTDAMYAVALVYETDVTRVKVGQRAVVKSAALASPLQGTVERIGLRVGRLDALGTNPELRSDARVVEVEVRLDDPAVAAALTDLEVDVLISL